MVGNVVLYVEDEDAAFLLFQTALEAARLEVKLHRATDGEQAIAFLNRTGEFFEYPRPDLIVLDLNLPRKSGLEVLSTIHQSDDLRGIAVVVFTSSSLSSDKSNCLALGARDYITKPFTFDLFVEAVKTACSHLPVH